MLSTTLWRMVTHCLNVTRPYDSSIPPFLTFTNTTEENMSGKKLLKGKQYRVLYLFDFWYYQIKVDYFPIVLYTNAIRMPRYNQETKKRQGLRAPRMCNRITCHS